jgi:peptidoglycan/LPS O-acetylase OafA/YrhL
MRAAAVLCVVLVHCAGYGGQVTGSLSGRLLAHTNIGVTIFFLVSGFLLYRPFIAHRGGGAEPPAVAAYAKRRFLRIYPAYWLILTILVVVPGLPGLGPVPLWPMYTLTQTIPIYHGSSCSQLIFTCSLAQTWSLGAEVSFYIALPLYALVTEWLTRGMTLRAWAATQAALLVALSAASIVVRFAVFYPAPTWVGWTVTGNVFWFALGMALAIASVATWTERYRRRLARTAAALSAPLWVAAAGLYVLLALWLPATSFLAAPGQQAVAHLAFGVISLLLLTPVVFAGEARGAPQRIAGARPVAWLGLISYGIFLWHFPLMEMIGLAHGTWAFLRLYVEVLAASGACAAASYYLLERTLMKLKYRPLLKRWGARAPLRAVAAKPPWERARLCVPGADDGVARPRRQPAPGRGLPVRAPNRDPHPRRADRDRPVRAAQSRARRAGPPSAGAAALAPRHTGSS